MFERVRNNTVITFKKGKENSPQVLITIFISPKWLMLLTDATEHTLQAMDLKNITLHASMYQEWVF